MVKENTIPKKRPISLCSCCCTVTLILVTCYLYFFYVYSFLPTMDVQQLLSDPSKSYELNRDEFIISDISFSDYNYVKNITFSIAHNKDSETQKGRRCVVFLHNEILPAILEWNSQIEFFYNAGYNIYDINLLGFDSSTFIEEAIDSQEYLRLIRKALNNFHSKDQFCHFVGHGYGGQIILDNLMKNKNTGFKSHTFISTYLFHQTADTYSNLVPTIDFFKFYSSFYKDFRQSFLKTSSLLDEIGVNNFLRKEDYQCFFNHTTERSIRTTMNIWKWLSRQDSYDPTEISLGFERLYGENNMFIYGRNDKFFLDSERYQKSIIESLHTYSFKLLDAGTYPQMEKPKEINEIIHDHIALVDIHLDCILSSQHIDYEES